MDLVKLHNNILRAEVYNGQLVSIIRDGKEFMHRGGHPEATAEEKKAWSNSMIYMFPIIGPAKDNTVYVDNEKYFLDQHGMSRALPWRLESSNEMFAQYVQKYHAGDEIVNQKYSGDDIHPRTMSLPYGFELRQTLTLQEDEVWIAVMLKNTSHRTIKYDMGAHPAFAIHGPVESGRILFGEEEITLEEVINSQPAKHLQGAIDVSYMNNGAGISLRSRGFRHTTAWSPGGKLICLEPETRIPEPGLNMFKQGLYDMVPAGEARLHTLAIKPVSH